MMAPSLKNDIDQLSNTINTMYDYVIKNGISSTTGKLKRKKSSGSSSNVRRKSLPRAAKNGSNTAQQTNGGVHATPCMSQAYGKTHGWAFNANKWSITIN